MPPASVPLLKQRGHEDYTKVFSSVAALFRVLKAQKDDFVIFQDVTPNAFEKVTAARERRGSKIRFHYYPATKQLLITIPTLPHESISGYVTHSIYENLRQMGLRYNDFKYAGSTTYPGGGGSSGEADTCFVPPARLHDPSRWPTLVIEAGVSQSLASLHAKMQWWFTASDHAAKMVLVIKATQASRTILIEKHIKDVLPTRLGATKTRPQLRQSITITPRPGSAPVVYDVRGGPLILEFALLFLRPADAARGERDIILNASSLSLLAERSRCVFHCAKNDRYGGNCVSTDGVRCVACAVDLGKCVRIDENLVPVAKVVWEAWSRFWADYEEEADEAGCVHDVDSARDLAGRYRQLGELSGAAKKVWEGADQELPGLSVSELSGQDLGFASYALQLATVRRLDRVLAATILSGSLGLDFSTEEPYGMLPCIYRGVMDPSYIIQLVNLLDAPVR